ARLTTEMLIMNTTSSKNPSSGLAGANGPPPASAPQTAKQERISTAVAVSRSPQRSAVHNSGNTAPNVSALLTALSSKSGLNATSPTRVVAMIPRIEDNTLSESKLRSSPSAQSTTAGASTSVPAASRSHHTVPRGTSLSHSGCPVRSEVPAATNAPSMLLVSPINANFATSAGVLKVLPPSDQRLRR